MICRVITGPTASGKSALALRLAEKTDWPILCMDSMQIYRGMDIGTAKPTREDRERVPHYLLDIRHPSASFSVSEYVREAETLLKTLNRGVLFVGGTGLYLQALIHPMGMGNVPADENLREELRCMSREALHARLESLDPDTAARLPLNDLRRVIRAIEVSETTGIPFSRQPERTTDTVHEWRVVSTAMDRPLLYDRINTRVDRMIAAGLREEVAALLQSGVPETAQSMQALGYKEMIAHLKGEVSLEEAAEQIRTGTRHYAKRQMTFLRRENAVSYVDVTRPDALDRVRELFDD